MKHPVNEHSRTECEPERLMMGASRLLVRLTDRIKPLFRGSLEDEIAI